MGKGTERGERSKLAVQGMRTKRAKDAESFLLIESFNYETTEKTRCCGPRVALISFRLMEGCAWRCLVWYPGL